MSLTLKTFKSTLQKELLKRAGKLTVREYDEVKKGQFVAYVDEGKESFDVSVAVTAKGEILSHTCECSNNSDLFCKHQVAVLLQMIKEAKSVPARKAGATKKESVSDVLLKQVDEADLRTWVRDVLKMNKDLEIGFVYHFTAKERRYTPEEVAKISTDAVKVTFGKKKNIDPTQLKKLVQLFETIHAPVVEQYRSNPSDKDSFLLLHEIIKSCEDVLYRLHVSGSAITKYMASVLERTVTDIHQLTAESAWENAIKFFIEELVNGNRVLRSPYLVHLESVFETSSTERQLRLIAWLATHYQRATTENVYNLDGYTKRLFKLAKTAGTLLKYFRIFQPIRYDNEFNLALIRVLIDNNEYGAAEGFCREQIARNVYQEYNVPYLLLLSEIYERMNNLDEKVKAMAGIVPFTLNYDDYCFVQEHLNSEEAKNFRTKMLTIAGRGAENQNRFAAEFYVRILSREANFRKLLDKIDYMPYTAIATHFDDLVVSDKVQLLNRLLQKQYYFWNASEEWKKGDNEAFQDLYALLKKHYGISTLSTKLEQAHKSRWGGNLNKFLDFLRARLQEEDEH